MNNNTELFQEYCKTGKLENAKQLYLLYPTTIDIIGNCQYAFKWACENGHLEVAKWLLTIESNIDISAYNDVAFTTACFNGHLEVAKWLLTIKPTINVSAEAECAFQLACRYGHLEVIQWLLTIKPTINIYAMCGYAFTSACENGHLKVAQWLQSICPEKYELVVENNQIISYCVKKLILYTNNTITISSKNTEELYCSMCYYEDQCVEIQTNCGHNFCNACITNYFNQIYGTCYCPYCEQPITTFNKLLINWE